ncbi:glycosyltransferase family 2 protein [Leifsonia sp. SIMBA_070]|uniref:glycosyltransferase family 2 protein n=1 Tax=Leifsonia sp. SIMBA_070 TaxID=3085810 RepID=UPI00397B8940
MSAATTTRLDAGERTVSRRWSGDWGRPPVPVRADVDVLIPTVGRIAELAVTLAGLCGQDDPPFSVILSDQSEDGAALEAPAVQAMVRVLRAQGREVRLFRHERRGLAEHRQFLLDQAQAPYCLFLDDDVWLEPGSIRRMADALTELGCGFVGSAVQGLSFLDDRRPHQRTSFEAWEGRVEPERIRIDQPSIERASLHSAANLVHVAEEVPVERDGWLAYKIAWLGGCVLYRRQALVDCGGFDFWRLLPPIHSGEDVAAEWRVMERFGGAGILPSGAVHLEAPTTVPDRRVEARDVIF